MRVFNKIIVVVLLVLALPLVTLALATPDLGLMLAGQALTALSAVLEGVSVPEGSTRLVMLGVAVGVDLIIVLLLYAELRRPARDQARIRLVGGGVAEISLQAISQRLKEQVSRIPDVVEVKPRISAARRRVRVALDVGIASSVGSIPAKAAEIIGVARETVENQMGLSLAGEPRVRIRHVSGVNLALRTAGRRRQQQPPPPSPPPVDPGL